MAGIILGGREISLRPGRTIIQAALSAGVYVPPLCRHPRLSPTAVAICVPSRSTAGFGLSVPVPRHLQERGESD